MSKIQGKSVTWHKTWIIVGIVFNGRFGFATASYCCQSSDYYLATSLKPVGWTWTKCRPTDRPTDHPLELTPFLPPCDSTNRENEAKTSIRRVERNIYRKLLWNSWNIFYKCFANKGASIKNQRAVASRRVVGRRGSKNSSGSISTSVFSPMYVMVVG